MPPKRKRFNLLRESLGNPSQLMLMREIRFVLQGCQTVLDVGCGNCSPLRFLSELHIAGLDGYPPALEEARRNCNHNEYILGDVKGITQLFPGRRFDACIALDVIEHLPKENGWNMVLDMERLASKLVIIFTPNGFLPERAEDGDLQQHLWVGPLRKCGNMGTSPLGCSGASRCAASITGWSVSLGPSGSSSPSSLIFSKPRSIRNRRLPSFVSNTFKSENSLRVRSQRPPGRGLDRSGPPQAND